MKGLKILVIGMNTPLDREILRCTNAYGMVDIMDKDCFCRTGISLLKEKTYQLLLFNLITNSGDGGFGSSFHTVPAEIKKVAVHTFTSPSLISNILSQGYSNYINIFNFEMELEQIINQQPKDWFISS